MEGRGQDFTSILAERNRNPPLAGEFNQPQIAPDRFFVLPVREIVAPQTTTEGTQFRFNSKPGMIIGMRGTVVDFTVGAFAADKLEQASIGVRITINDNDNLTTNTNAADFVPFADLFVDGETVCPLYRRMAYDDVLVIEFRNFQPLIGGHNLTASLTLHYLLDLNAKLRGM